MDENLLQQLQSGENIHIVLNPMDQQQQQLPQPQLQQQQPLPPQQKLPTAKDSLLLPNVAPKDDPGRKSGPLRPKLEVPAPAADDLSRILSDDNPLASISSVSEPISIGGLRDWTQEQVKF